MAEHGALPEEVILRKQLAKAKAAYAAAPESDRKTVMARIADLEMKLSIAVEARKRFMR
jgi:hypothetical protein